MTRTNLTSFDVISVSDMDRITLEINGQLYDMPVAVAKLLASDIRAAVKRAGVK